MLKSLLALASASFVLSASVSYDPQLALKYVAQEELLKAVPEGFNLDLDAKRLVQFAPNEEPVWVTEREKIIAKASSVNFFDIIATYNASKRIKSTIKLLSTKGPRANLRKFTSFRTRYYRSLTGRESQLWLLSKINEVTSKTASDELQTRITVNEFEHPWGQNSIIVRIRGTSMSKDTGSVIISAHQDSTNFLPFLPAPGADDDGSGTVTILETYRVLLAANFTPIHDVEWHFYSAEEGGLLGSQAVVNDYVSQGAKVKSQLQFDMTAWVKQGTKEVVGVITDFVNPKLTSLIEDLIDTYLDIPWVETKCGYACSDHASWNKAGIPSAFGIESAFEDSNKNIHSTNDRLDISPEFSFDHMLEFSKLGVAYVATLAGWA
ncbi:uncharacterized protein EI90DRAFT_3228136 [Cantharellus anzutake]|uniref:uncharacterized protein n=1 Tax=Cantharellus anzutake TaxID=1750568 RepID=UPI001902E9D6|nr:uncharacterized protein EI90DRAFT_3228136 [Cantharellus anzutake]KAF8326535.1 hypothetical protein EI90DRAFT_3228136 [Cantharellus anzutake]